MGECAGSPQFTHIAHDAARGDRGDTRRSHAVVVVDSEQEAVQLIKELEGPPVADKSRRSPIERPLLPSRALAACAPLVSTSSSPIEIRLASIRIRSIIVRFAPPSCPAPARL